MLAVFNVLYMTRSAIGFVFGNQDAVTSLLDSSVMTFTASRPWRDAIDGTEGFMTTGTGEFTL